MGDIAHAFQFRHIFNCFDEKESKYLAKHKNHGVDAVEPI